jgi:hypothetical protein
MGSLLSGTQAFSETFIAQYIFVRVCYIWHNAQRGTRPKGAIKLPYMESFNNDKN